MTDLTLNQKIGKNVIRYTPVSSGTTLLSSFRLPEYREHVLEILKKTDRPLSITETWKLSDIRSWLTVKSILMDLVVAGEVECFRSGRALLFSVKREEIKQDFQILKCSLKNCSEQAIGTFTLKGFKQKYALCQKHFQKAKEKDLLL